MLWVLIIKKEINIPIRYEPESPKNNFAFGKFKKRIAIKTDKKLISSIFIFWLSSKYWINNNITQIIIEWINNSPLKPSIKFAPLIIVSKHIIINIILIQL